jgi:hypothetical protein
MSKLKEEHIRDIKQELINEIVEFGDNIKNYEIVRFITDFRMVDDKLTAGFIDVTKEDFFPGRVLEDLIREQAVVCTQDEYLRKYAAQYTRGIK